MVKVDFKLRDYLTPGNRRPYIQLAPDLEAALAAGDTVYLWSVPGFFMLSGHPDTSNLGPKYRAWSDGDKWYKTAADCLKSKNGKR